MTDLERILALWRELEAAGVDYVLATVVAVQGSSYRKPGALILLTADGRRAGTVSGGCLEAQVASRAWWLTANGPTVQHYSTAEDDGDRPFGPGCGGTVFLLLERRATAFSLLRALEKAFDHRTPMVAATVLEGLQVGRRAFAFLHPPPTRDLEPSEEAPLNLANQLQQLAQQALDRHESIDSKITFEGSTARAWADYRPARPALGIFGAGDDAQPLVSLAKELGWFVSVADGRSHLTTRDRFSRADRLAVLPIPSLPIKDLPDLSAEPSVIAFSFLQPHDAAVVMTHSFEQDSKILACLFSLQTPPAYIGVLGPQRRTRELLEEAAHLLEFPSAAIANQAERWLAVLHAPTGLDLGAVSPETIALSILAEIQKSRTSASALPLHTVRAAGITLAG